MEKIQAFLGFPLFTWDESVITVGQLVIGPVIISVLWIGYRWLERIIVSAMKGRGVDADLIQLVRRIFLVIVIIITAVTVLELLHVPLTAFAFISGAVAIGIGFGAQNIINNFISGWILMWERPIRIGDFLEIGDTKGSVEAINTRSTRIKRVDGVHLLVPNSQLLENTVVNWTLVDHLTRTDVSVGVAYGSPVEKVRELLTELVTSNTSVLETPPPVILFTDFGDNSLMFSCVFWVNATRETSLHVTRSDIRFSIDKTFNEHGIVIAFPQRDVHINSVAPIEVKIIKDG